MLLAEGFSGIGKKGDRLRRQPHQVAQIETGDLVVDVKR